MVTDGKHIWVVDDNSVDKVFKYTVAGSLVGSWTIKTPNTLASVGITLDPANPSHLWIVDSYLEEVFQYNAAVLHTSGSFSADASFPLTPGNYDSQGIADPPAPIGQVCESALPIIVDSAESALPGPAEVVGPFVRKSSQAKSDAGNSTRRIDTVMAQWSDKLVIQRQSLRRQAAASMPHRSPSASDEMEKNLDDRLEQAVDALLENGSMRTASADR